jgi:protein-S-isoprenylcysteine O-methyltransferase Ste14
MALVKALAPVVRALTYATIFVSLVLVFVPARVLEWSGVTGPPAVGTWQVLGGAGVVLGAALALWCVLAFAIVGRGTPAPFDAPRRLVIRGPYRFVRNPMYIGAGLALSGAALYFGSWAVLGYTAIFFLITHLFVVLYEEPALRRTFGEEYLNYSSRVRRWLPRWDSQGATE